MLSMVAVSVRRERQKYYLQLSHEDYYVRKGEPLGEWVGRGAARLGLSGPVDGFEFLCLLDGVSRDGITPLLRVPQGKDHDPGWDLTFSAPKGISVIWAVSPPAVQAQIEASIRAAAADTVDYVETHYKLARRGPQGRRREHADLVASAFFHCTSRELDPNLHIHLLLMNAAVRADGTTGAILSRPLFRDQLHLGHAFRYALAGHLQRGPGIETYWYGKDLMDACGVPETVKRAMSQRRQQMDQYLEARGLTSAAAAQAAALATRRPKEIRARELLFQDWGQRLRQLGFGPEQAAALVQRPATAPSPEPAVEPVRRDHREAPGPEPVHELAPRQDTGASLEPEQAPADQLGGQQEVERQGRRRSRRPQPGKSASPGPSPAELSEEQAAAVLIDLAREEEAFTRQAGFEELMRRTRRQPWRLAQLGDLFFAAVRAAQLMIEEVRDVIICLRADLLREVCERMLEQAEALQQGRKCGFGPAILAPSVFRRTLTEQQLDVFDHLVGKGGRLRLVDGMLNAEAMRLLGEACHVWNNAGYKVKVIAPNQQAAELFGWSTGLEAHGASRWVRDLAPSIVHDGLKHLWMLGRAASGLPTYAPSEGRLTIDRKSVVLVLDAGGMRLADLALVVDCLHQTRSVGLLFGDVELRSLDQPVEPSRPAVARVPNPFAELQAKLGEPTRSLGSGPVLPVWRRDVLEQLTHGENLAALQSFAAHGRLKVTREEPEAWQQLLQDWQRKGARRPREHLILAPDAATAHGLNRRAQQRREALGELGVIAARAGTDRIYARDRVELLRTRRSLGIAAGQLGTVIAVEPVGNTVTIRLDVPHRHDNGIDETRLVQLSADEVRLGYAVTAAPGRSYRQEHCYGLVRGDRDGLYRQAAQASGELHLYLGLDQASAPVRAGLEPLAPDGHAPRRRQPRRQQQRRPAETTSASAPAELVSPAPAPHRQPEQEPADRRAGRRERQLERAEDRTPEPTPEHLPEPARQPVAQQEQAPTQGRELPELDGVQAPDLDDELRVTPTGQSADAALPGPPAEAIEPAPQVPGSEPELDLGLALDQVQDLGLGL